MTGVVRLNVRHLETGALTKFDICEPFAVIGRDPACQIRLDDSAVSRRHAYLQVLQGRLHCFDLGSRSGLRFRDGLRVEGILSGTDSLIIGPFQIRLSQAPAYRLYANEDGGPDFDNGHAEHAHLAFGNAQGRSSRRGVRKLRERVTLVGRCRSCHVKLSDDSVGRIHASIVRTPVGHWLVNLRPDKSCTVRGRAAVYDLLATDDRLEIGRFRMRFGVGAAPATSPSSKNDLRQLTVPGLPTNEGEPVSQQWPSRKSRRTRRTQRNRQADASEQVLLTALEQFGQMQQQLLGQTHHQSMMLARVIAAMQQEHNAAIYDQIARIQAVTDELMALQRPRLEVSPEFQSNISGPAEVSQAGSPVEEIQDIEVHAQQSNSSEVAPGTAGQGRGARGSNRQGGHSASSPPDRKSAPDRIEAYDRVTRRIHELERERTKGWQKVMSMLGVKEEN